MDKKIWILVIVLLVIAGIYWLSSIDTSNYGAAPNEEAVNTSNTEETAEITITDKGPLGVAAGSAGEYLVDNRGLTLYVKASDALKNTSGIKTSCNAECEKIWPPFLLGAEELGITETDDALLSKLNLFTRADGKQQYALGNQPLYTYAGDEKIGDMKGDGLANGDWMVAKP